jgi:outer membrane protein OmpA-like peptidoglycan-associated protein
MNMKTRLFASAAFPLLSFSLVMPPAGAFAAGGASPLAAGEARHAVAGSFEVAQDAPAGEELLRKRRPQRGEAPAEEQQAPEGRQRPEGREAPEPRRQEAPAAEPDQQEAPQAEQPRQRQERRQREAPAEQEPQAEPRQQEQQPEQRQGEPQRQRTQRRSEQPQTEQTPAERPQTEQAEPEQAQPERQPQDEQRPRERSRDRQQRNGESQSRPAEQPAQPAPAAPAQPESGRQRSSGSEPAAPAQPDAGQGQAPAATEPAPRAAPTEQGTQQPGGQQQGGEPPAAETNTLRAPAEGGEQAGEAIPAREKITPEELERRKQIAEDPSKSNETVVLPVENGAAVLDSDKDAARFGTRERSGGRDRQPAGEQEVKVPTSDADAQAAAGGQVRAPVRMEAVTREEGRRLDGRPQFERPRGAEFGERRDDSRIIMQFDNRTIVRSDDDRRFLRGGERPVYEELSRDRYRETIERPEGYRIVTVRNRYGDIIQRSRIDSSGREYVLYYSPELYDDPDRGYFEDPGADLPPMRLRIPLRDYIIDTSSDPDRDYYEFLSEPPVEPVERVYSLNEVKYSARIRDKVRRIDLDTITFATGSAEIPMSQAQTLKKVADAINQVLEKDPSETFLIEGHTDAVGSDQSNLILSDERAESVANLLTDVYDIPPENLATQGYGERYLKVNTAGPEQENRRVTIRRVTPLVRPVAENR